MAMHLLRVVALCALALSPWAHASSATQQEVAFYRDAESPPLLSLVNAEEKTSPALDREWIWRRYESHLLSKTRFTAFIVLFTSENDCDSIVEDAENEEEPVAESEIERRVRECRQQRDHVELVVNATQKALSQQRSAGPTTTIVRIPRSLLPHAFDYHRVSSSPSLLWLPPRSSSLFQRYPHPQTNFLDLSAASSDTDVPDAISTFLQRCAKQSASFAKKVPLSMEGSTAETVINALPFIGIGLYVLVLAIEHRAKVLTVLQSRVTWLVVTEGIVYVSLSGLFHSIIHKMPPFVAHPQHGVYFIHPSGRKQFFLEGLVNGSWSFWISFGLFSIVDILPKLRSPYARDELFQYALLAIGIAYILLHLIFSAKHRWLNR